MGDLYCGELGVIRHAFNEARENPQLVPLALFGAARGVHEVYLKPAVAENPAVAAWIACLAVPGVYDAWALKTKHETMSHAFHRAWEHPNPAYKYLCAGLIGVLALHLCRSTGDAVAPKPV